MGRHRRGRRGAGVVIGALLAVLVLVPLTRGLDLLPDVRNPFATEEKDRTGPALQVALRDLADYRAAQGTFQVVVDLERDTPWLPSAISGERTTYVATGTVDGIVDFSQLPEGAVVRSPDGRSATITLPAPRLTTPVVDQSQSRVVARDRGVIDRVGGAFVDNPTSERPAVELAQQRIAKAAAESDILRRSEDNTRAMLTGLARSFGVEQVTVVFEPAPLP